MLFGDIVEQQGLLFCLDASSLGFGIVAGVLVQSVTSYWNREVQIPVQLTARHVESVLVRACRRASSFREVLAGLSFDGQLCPRRRNTVRTASKCVITIFQNMNVRSCAKDLSNIAAIWKDVNGCLAE